MPRLIFHIAVAVFLAVPASLFAAPVLINFDDLNDTETITGQFAGITFANAIALSAGVSLNEFEFPPRSGSNVASDDGGPIRLAFAQPASAVGGYFTYAVPVTVSAFNAANVLLGSVSSLFSSNMGLSGDGGSSPNELIQLAFSNIAYVTFAGSSLGGSFTVDDLTYTLSETTPPPVPEPAMGSLLILGALSFGYRRLIRRCDSHDIHYG
jgi:hypothetical protein